MEKDLLREMGMIESESEEAEEENEENVEEQKESMDENEINDLQQQVEDSVRNEYIYTPKDVSVDAETNEGRSRKFVRFNFKSKQVL